MAQIDPIESITERLGQHATVKSVYGEPIEFGNTAVVPVAKIGYGFGGGYGSDEDDEGGSGAGGGGGLSAKPIGALELTDDGARFVRFESKKRVFLAFLLGIAVGVLWGRRT